MKNSGVDASMQEMFQSPRSAISNKSNAVGQNSLNKSGMSTAAKKYLNPYEKKKQLLID